ncbi:MAG: transporter substrate-binding domain-containing protein [Burkholderiaceae bacterium]
MPYRRVVLGVWSLCFAATLAWAQTTVVYPIAESTADHRDDYQVELLALALKKSGRPYVLRPHATFMLQGRELKEVERGDALDVIWTMTSAEREQALLPVRVPIDRGLLGWRLLLVREQALPQFAALAQPTQLRLLRAGQGFDWPDTAILKHAGFNVDETVRYNDLFLRLAAGRIDYFPRSVQEVWGELDSHAGQGLAVEPTLALHYPAAMYYFVNRRNTALAADIQRGLEAALADGSFEALFQRHFGAALARAGLGQRRVLELANPLLPPETPLANRALWYRPAPR